jgi:hypothetical protein
MASQLLSTAGLIFDMIGVALLFIFGPPQPSFEEGIPLGLEDATPLPDGRTVADHNADTRARRRRYSAISRMALSLIFLGFLLQLTGLWWGH